MKRVIFLAGLALVLMPAMGNGQTWSTPARSDAVWKCEIDGLTVLQGKPCPRGTHARARALTPNGSSRGRTTDEAEIAARQRIGERHRRARIASEKRRALPELDVEARCRNIASALGTYNAQIYNTCISMEQDAYRSVGELYSRLPESAQQNCTKVAQALVGGSYQGMQACLKQQAEALENPVQFQR